ncbi:MAG: c-type cytochrome [Gammaproteobacteria bacterium]|nr:c-type cytochrome [Gammaproteobacteria bacterium]
MRQTLRVIFIAGIFTASSAVCAEEGGAEAAVKKAVATAVMKSTSDLARGQKIYADNCSVCHGDKGVGSKWTRNTLNPSPRDFTSPLAVTELTRERMLQAVIAGREGSAMVSYLGDLSISDVIAVVDFIRSEFMRPQSENNHPHVAGAHQSTREIQKAVDMQLPFDDSFVGEVITGRHLYLGNCAACHGVDGDGLGDRKSASQPLPRNFLSTESRQILNRPALYKGIAEGKNGTVMPSWARVFTNQEIVDVAEYVFQTFIDPVESHVDEGKKKVITH